MAIEETKQTSSNIQDDVLHNDTNMIYRDFQTDDGDDIEYKAKTNHSPEIAEENRGKATTIDLEHEFTDDELSVLAVQITAMDNQIDKLESEMEGYKRSVNRLKKEIEEQDNERRALSRKYRIGKEVRTLSVMLVENYDVGQIEYYEIPSGILVHTMPISDGGMFDKTNEFQADIHNEDLDDVFDNDDIEIYELNGIEN